MGYSIDVHEAKGNNDKLKGVASVVIDKSFKIKNIAIMEGKKGLFVAMPRFKSQDKNGNDVYKDVCHPIKADFRKQLYDDIMATFQEAMKNEERHAKFESQDIKETPDLNVSVFPIEKGNSTLKGVAKIYLNDNFIVENIPIREGKEGKAFVAMPSYKVASTGQYKDIVHPVSAEFKKALDAQILEQLEQNKNMEVNHEENPFEPGTFDNRAVKEAEKTIEPVTEPSIMQQAEQLINDMEQEKTIFSKDERNLIVNYAYKLGDMEKTRELAEHIAMYKENSFELLVQTVINAQEEIDEIDALPDGIEQPDVPFPDAKNLKWCVIEQKEGQMPQLIVYDQKEDALQYAENTWANAREYSRRHFEKLEVELHNVVDKGYGFFALAEGADGKPDTKVYDKAKGLADFKAEDKAHESMSWDSLKQDLADKKVAEKEAPKADKTNKNKDMEIG